MQGYSESSTPKDRITLPSGGFARSQLRDDLFEGVRFVPGSPARNVGSIQVSMAEPTPNDSDIYACSN